MKSGWFVRFHVQTQEGFQPDEPSFDAAASSGGFELTVRASGDGILFAQVAREGEVPLVVALPVYGPTSSQSCRLTLAGTPGALSADVSLPDNPQVDAVARYLQSGHLQEAAGVIENAETLLQQKMADPFGAALGGYALLRSGQVDRLHHWPQNLAGMFPMLPDGAVIAGEELALEGDHAGAIAFVCDAARRGLPVFATGFSLLASRLREYAGAPTTAFGGNGALVDEVGRHLERILRVMPFVDFARVSFAFRGGRIDDPADSQARLHAHRRRLEGALTRCCGSRCSRRGTATRSGSSTATRRARAGSSSTVAPRARTTTAFARASRRSPPEERSFELLVVTHVDSDHIAGVLELLRDEAIGATFGEVWFNAWRHLQEALEGLGPVEGELLTQTILARDLAWNDAFDGDGRRASRTRGSSRASSSRTT